MPEVQSTNEIFEQMETKFRAEKATNLNATIQFDISGDDGGTWNAAIADGSCKISEGPAESPNATVKASAEDWANIVNGGLNPQMAFMTGKLKVQGDIALATKLQALFF